MTTVIVPVDFSETSLNAARYAKNFLTGHYGVTMILYHSFSKSSDEESIIASLEKLKIELSEDHLVKMEVFAHLQDNFVAGLDRMARHRRANLVIMGITGKSALAQVLFGSNTLKMAETKACPVLIIPEHASFKPLKNVMLTSDFEDTLNSTPSVSIKEFLIVHRPQLHVINVDKDHYISLTEEYEKEKQNLKKLLSDFNPVFYFMRLYDVDEAINLFAEDRNIDLVIVVQKDQSWMDRFLKTSRTKKMSFQSKLPVLVIHE